MIYIISPSLPASLPPDPHSMGGIARDRTDAGHGTAPTRMFRLSRRRQRGREGTVDLAPTEGTTVDLAPSVLVPPARWSAARGSGGFAGVEGGAGWCFSTHGCRRFRSLQGKRWLCLCVCVCVCVRDGCRRTCACL